MIRVNLTYCIVLLFVVFLFGCEPQELSENQSEKFLKIYGDNNENRINDILIDNEGVIALGAMGNNGETGIWLFKTDKFGNAVWKNNNLKWSTNDVGAVLHKIDNNFIGAGTALDEESLKNDLLVFAFTDNGDTLWSKTYDTLNIAVVASICSDTSNNFYISAIIENNNTNNTCAIFKLNDSGNLNWIRTFGGSIHSTLYLENAIYFAGLKASLTENSKYSLQVGAIDPYGITLDYGLFEESDNFSQAMLSSYSNNQILVAVSSTTSDNKNSKIVFKKISSDNIHNSNNIPEYAHEGALTLKDLKYKNGKIILGVIASGTVNNVKLLELKNNESVTELFSLNSINNIQCNAIEVMEDYSVFLAGSSDNDNHSEGILIKYNPLYKW